MNLCNGFENLKLSFPELYIIENGARIIGKLKFYDITFKVHCEYGIEIKFLENYLYPVVYCLDDSFYDDKFHINPDNSLCLEMPIVAGSVWGNSEYNINEFVNKLVLPYFSKYTYAKENNKLNEKLGWSHGTDGKAEYYETILKNYNPKIILELVHRYATNTCTRLPCPCESGLRFRNCHKRIFDSLNVPNDMKKNLLETDFAHLFIHYERLKLKQLVLKNFTFNESTKISNKAIRLVINSYTKIINNKLVKSQK